MSRPVWLPLVFALAVLAALRIPVAPPPAYAIDCDTYPNQLFAQLFLRIDPDDPQGLDGPDDNGIACEDLPCPCDTEPVEEAIGDEEDGDPSPTPTEAGVSASAGDVRASASAGAANAGASVNIQAPPPTATSAPPAPTPGATFSGVITPPSTGSGGLQ